MDNGQWTMDNGQWTMDNGQWYWGVKVGSFNSMQAPIRFYF
jgi:hypothetical protein